MATTWKRTTNQAAGTLAEILTSNATSFTLQSGEGGEFPEDGPFWVVVFGDTVDEGSEIILVEQLTGDTFSSCTRGEQGTTPAQWNAGANVQMLWTAGNADQIMDAISALETGTVLTDLAYTQEIQVRKAGTSVTSQVTLFHSRGTVDSPSATLDGDTVGTILFEGYAAGGGETALAAILAMPDGQTPNPNDSPGKLVFQTVPNASATPAAALTLLSDKSATAGGLGLQVWDADGYIPLSAIKTGTTNNSKVLTAGATEGSAGWQSLESNLPATEGQEGKFLGCDAEGAIWTDLPSDLPDMTGNNGKYLTTDGSSASWGDITFPEEIPDQTGNTGKFLTTDGSDLSWGTPDAGDALPDQTGNEGLFLTTNGSVASWAAPTAVPGENSVGATELKEDEAITLLSLILSGFATGDTTPLTLRTARGSAESPTNCAANDDAILQFSHYLNSGYRNTASIRVAVDGTAGSGDYPSRMEFRVSKDGTAAEHTNANIVIKNSGIVGIGEPTPDAAQLTVYQSASAFNFPVLKLQQGDQDEPFIEFTGTSAADTTKNISTAGIGTFTGRIRCSINGTDYWIPYYAAT